MEHDHFDDFTSQVESPSEILRKLTIHIQSQAIHERFEKKLIQVQKTAKVKGFRPGHVPIAIVKEYYGSDVRQQVCKNLIDESYHHALEKHHIHPLGHPKIEPARPDGLSLAEGTDLAFVATVEVMPDIQIKNYSGISLKKDKIKISDDELKEIEKHLQEHFSELIPVTDGSDNGSGNRLVKKGDFVDFNFSGAVLTAKGLKEHSSLKGTKVVEIGGGTLIPEFEENLISTKKGETKIFQIKMPDDPNNKELSSKDVQFTVTINEIKEKRLSELTDELAKQAGYENLQDFKTKEKEKLLKLKEQEINQKLKDELLKFLIEKNSFEVPQVLIQSQLQNLIQDIDVDLRSRGFNEKMVQEAIVSKIEDLKKRAETQVRASLILDKIAKQETIQIFPEEVDTEIKKMAEGMKLEVSKIKEFYDKSPDKKDNLEFRLLQEKTIDFLLGKAKIQQK